MDPPRKPSKSGGSLGRDAKRLPRPPGQGRGPEAEADGLWRPWTERARRPEPVGAEVSGRSSAGPRFKHGGEPPAEWRGAHDPLRDAKATTDLPRKLGRDSRLDLERGTEDGFPWAGLALTVGMTGVVLLALWLLRGDFVEAFRSDVWTQLRALFCVAGLAVGEILHGRHGDAEAGGGRFLFLLLTEGAVVAVSGLVGAALVEGGGAGGISVGLWVAVTMVAMFLFGAVKGDDEA